MDAIGADKVQAVMMPYTYTSKMSVEDATEQARRKGVTLVLQKSIQLRLHANLYPFFGNSPADATEENLQARTSWHSLMGLSNKFGNLVLSTGNKSEISVGYCTLYGDMVGGFLHSRMCIKPSCLSWRNIAILRQNTCYP